MVDDPHGYRACRPYGTYRAGEFERARALHLYTVLRRLWEAWKDLAGYIGDFQSRFILTVFYFTIMVPFAFISKLTGSSLAETTDGWLPRSDDDTSLEAARKQF